MAVTDQDIAYMRHALQLAEKGLFTTDPNPRVGCVLVKNDRIIGEGWHEYAGQPHAEVMAIQTTHVPLDGTCCYVTLEPCCHQGLTPPCTKQLIKANISRVVVATTDPNPQVAGKGVSELLEAGIEVEVGVLEKEARELNKGFMKRQETGLPYVVAKLGMSIDAKTAMASGESQWITGKQARREVQVLRARSGAVMTGSGTVITDDPSLNVRHADLPLEYQKHPLQQPIRVILDSKARLDKDAKIFHLDGEAVWVSTEDSDISSDTVECLKVSATSSGKIELLPVLQWLGERGVNEVLLEAGANLAGAFVAEDLVDELVIFMAPKVLGHKGRSLLNIPHIEKLTDAKTFQFIDAEVIDQDIRLRFIKG